MISPRNSRFLDYREVNHGNGVTIYAVSVPGAEHSHDGEVRWGGHQGYAARTTFRKPIYHGHRETEAYITETIEVAVNGIGLRAARKKLDRAIAAERTYREPSLAADHQKREAHKKHAAARAAHNRQNYHSVRRSSSW